MRAVSSIDSYIYSDSLAYIDSNFSYSFFNSLAGIFRIISMPLLCLYAGVAYNELRSCSSIAYMYLCGAYPLAQVFSVLAIIAVVQTLIAFKTINLIKME